MAAAPILTRILPAKELAYYRLDFRGAIREDDIICLECGAVRRALEAHARHKHHLSSEEYKEKWGYNRWTALIAHRDSEQRRQRSIELGLAKYLTPGIGIGAMIRARRARPTYRLETCLDRAESMRALYAAGFISTLKPQKALKLSVRRKVEDETLRKLFGEGLATRDIAVRTGVHPYTVRVRLKALGFTLRRVTNAQEILKLCRRGLRATQIAARTGIPVSTVRSRLHRLRRRGVTIPIPRGAPTIRGPRIASPVLLGLIHRGLGPDAIAARLGIAANTVRSRIADLRKRRLLPPAQVRDSRSVVSNAKLLRYAGKGLGPAAIAARVGLTYDVVAGRLQRLRQRNLLPPSRSKPVPSQLRLSDNELRSLVHAGFGARRIADRAGISATTVKKRLKALGEYPLRI